MTQDELAARIVRAMTARGYVIDKGFGEINIVYVEGMDMDGSKNANRPNAYDDLRILISFRDDKPFIVGMWHATTQTGVRLRDNPVSGARALGSAIITLGQQRCWTVDLHSGKYEALCQRAAVCSVHRDANKDSRRDGDQITTGWYGINQHHGGDSPRENIGGHSAGCLVTPKVKDHETFMRLVKTDPRYRVNPGRAGFVFRTTVMPADWVLQEYPKPVAEKVLVGLGLSGLGIGTYHLSWTLFCGFLLIIGIAGAVWFWTRKGNQNG